MMTTMKNWEESVLWNDGLTYGANAIVSRVESVVNPSVMMNLDESNATRVNRKFATMVQPGFSIESEVMLNQGFPMVSPYPDVMDEPSKSRRELLERFSGEFQKLSTTESDNHLMATIAISSPKVKIGGPRRREGGPRRSDSISRISLPSESWHFQWQETNAEELKSRELTATMDIVDIPVFPDVDLKKWISWMEEYFSRKQLTSLERLHMAHGFIVGEAEQYVNLINSMMPIRNWKEMKETLLLKFGADDDPEKIRLIEYQNKCHDYLMNYEQRRLKHEEFQMACHATKSVAKEKSPESNSCAAMDSSLETGFVHQKEAILSPQVSLYIPESGRNDTMLGDTEMNITRVDPKCALQEVLHPNIDDLQSEVAEVKLRNASSSSVIDTATSCSPVVVQLKEAVSSNTEIVLEPEVVHKKSSPFRAESDEISSSAESYVMQICCFNNLVSSEELHQGCFGKHEDTMQISIRNEVCNFHVEKKGELTLQSTCVKSTPIASQVYNSGHSESFRVQQRKRMRLPRKSWRFKFKQRRHQRAKPRAAYQFFDRKKLIELCKMRLVNNSWSIRKLILIDINFHMKHKWRNKQFEPVSELSLGKEALLLWLKNNYDKLQIISTIVLFLLVHPLFNQGYGDERREKYQNHVLLQFLWRRDCWFLKYCEKDMKLQIIRLIQISCLHQYEKVVHYVCIRILNLYVMLDTIDHMLQVAAKEERRKFQSASLRQLKTTDFPTLVIMFINYNTGRKLEFTVDYPRSWLQLLQLEDRDTIIFQSDFKVPVALKRPEFQPHGSSHDSSPMILLSTSLRASLFSREGVYKRVLACLLLWEVMVRRCGREQQEKSELILQEMLQTLFQDSTQDSSNWEWLESEKRMLKMQVSTVLVKGNMLFQIRVSTFLRHLLLKERRAVVLKHIKGHLLQIWIQQKLKWKKYYKNRMFKYKGRIKQVHG